MQLTLTLSGKPYLSLKKSFKKEDLICLLVTFPFFSCRIFVPNTNKNLNLYNFGIPVAGDFIQLWATGSGIHETWEFIQGKYNLFFLKNVMTSCI
jgi:hypothetical protein